MKPSRQSPQPPPRPQPPSVIEVLDRVLDKGVVIIASVAVSVVGMRLVDIHARVVVSSIDTYVARADVIEAAVAAPPPLRAEPARPPALPGPVRAALPAPARPVRPRRRRKVVRAFARKIAPKPVPALVRCAAGCTFARDAVTRDGGGQGGTVACPYERGVTCRVE